MLPPYAELHCRSNFSFLTGASHPEELVLRAAHLGYSALAITDECSLSGVVRAHTEAKRCGLHLIIGSEMQLTLPAPAGTAAGEGHARLVLLAQTRRGYGNLSQRLEALSQTVAAPATAATPAAAPAPTPSVDATPAAAPVAAGTTPPAASIAVPVATAAKTPLLDAFTKLFNALKPAATDTTAATPATDMSEKLRQFLQSLAQALAPDTSGSVQRAQLGGLVNLTA